MKVLLLARLFLGASAASAFLSVGPRKVRTTSRHAPANGQIPSSGLDIEPGGSPSTSRRSLDIVATQSSASIMIKSPSSALQAVPAAAALSAAGTSVAKFYRTFPLVAGFLTASTKAAFADGMAQRRDAGTKKFSVRRNLAMVLYSGLVLGVSVEFMYNHVFPVMFYGSAGAASASAAGASAVPITASTAVKMTLFDGLINAPLLWLPPAYLVKAMVHRRPKREALRKYVSDVRENGLLKKYWCVWMPMSMVNFLFVPEHFRVAFVAMVSFFWMIVLSVVANGG